MLMLENIFHKQSSSVRRVVISLVLCMVIPILGWMGFSFLSSLRKPPAKREPVEKIYNVEVFGVEPADVQEIISGFGTARADREVTLSAEVAGTIEAIHFRLKIGQDVYTERVRLGKDGRSETMPADVLVQIDRKTYQERVVQGRKKIAEAAAELEQLEQEKKNLKGELEKSKKDLEEYRQEYQRVLQLKKDGVLVESDVTRARLELQRYELLSTRAENQVKLLPFREKQINARIETHNADLKISQLDLERTVVIPPFSGTLSDVTVEKGQYVRPGDPLVKITDKSIVEVAVPVTLEDYSKIEAALRRGENDLQQMSSVALAENETDKARWIGRVVRAAPIADELTRTVNIFIRVDNRNPPDVTGRVAEKNIKPWRSLLPGTFVHARIDGPISEQILVVPRDAVVNERLETTVDKQGVEDQKRVGKVFVAVSKRNRDEEKAVQDKISPAERETEVQKEEIFLVEERTVTVKRILHSLAVISAGLQPGDRVILTNLDIIYPGAKVRIQSHRKLADEIGPRKTRMVRGSLAGGGSDGEERNRN